MPRCWDSNYVRTCRWHVHEPVQTLVNTLISFRVPRKGKSDAGESLTACVPAEPGQGAGYVRWQRNGGELPLRGDLIRRCAPPSPCAGKALTNQRASRRRRDKGLDIETDRTPHPASASRRIGGCHLLLKEKALANPNQRASRRRRDKGLDAGAFFATSSDIRLAWDRRMPPSPQGEGFGESQPACVLPQAGQEAEYQSSLRHLIRHPPRGGSADATFPSRGRLRRIPTSVRPGGAGTRGWISKRIEHLIRHPPRGRSVDATFSSRRRRWCFPFPAR